MWHDMFGLGIGIDEKVLRTVAVYFGIAILLRLAGKRDLAELNSFDLVVMLLLSNVVQNAIIGDDLSLTGGLVGAVVLIAVNAVVVRLTSRFEPLHKLLEGTPTVLAKHGQFQKRTLERLGLRRGDVAAAVRRQGANGVADLDRLTLEPGGALVADLRPELQPATKGDIEALHAAIQRLEQRLDRRE
jgi:uncharacterized membrane protein YcaP (DUF421 family)